MASHEVQGRRSPDGVRLATENSHRAALVMAGEMAAEGFTVWVFETTPDPRGKKYRLLDTIRPHEPELTKSD